jgi:DNA repair exonuclease SbcCD ATPase subunit
VLELSLTNSTAYAATELDLARIVELMTKVENILPDGHDHRFGHSNRQVSDRGMWDQQRLSKKVDDLQQQWELLNKKLSGLNKQLILENRSDEKLRLEELIHDIKTQLDQVEEQLKDMESQLAKVDSDAKEVTGQNDDQGLPEFTSTQDSSLKQFVQGIEALQGLRDELKVRVDEHSRLQYLDRELRRGCVGGMTVRTLNADWQRIKRVRTKFAPPFSSELELVYDDLTEIESEVEVAIKEGDNPAAQAKIEEYFMSVGSVFRAVDTSLKNFCMRLAKVSQPLKTILDMC